LSHNKGNLAGYTVFAVGHSSMTEAANNSWALAVNGFKWNRMATFIAVMIFCQ
jgi:hypothetical protein